MKRFIFVLLLFNVGCQVPACMDRRCLKDHVIIVHEEAWMEVRIMTCGKDCTYPAPIWHPARDYPRTVCDLWETDLERDRRRAGGILEKP